MNGQGIQSKLYKGYAKAAAVIGTSYQHFRPNGVSNPLAMTNQLPNIMVSLNADDPTYARPNVYGLATWYAIMDGAQMQVGDYIIGIEGTLFVAALQQLLPIFMVDCNRTINVLRVTMDTGPGVVSYSGDSPITETVLMSGWPASVLQGTKGEANAAKLPGDVRQPWWNILLPAVQGVTIEPSDLVTDDLGRRYSISSAELTDLGWRITARQEVV